MLFIANRLCHLTGQRYHLSQRGRELRKVILSPSFGPDAEAHRTQLGPFADKIGRNRGVVIERFADLANHYLLNARVRECNDVCFSGLQQTARVGRNEEVARQARQGRELFAARFVRDLRQSSRARPKFSMDCALSKSFSSPIRSISMA